MDDKNLMENILMLEKGACDLFMHGTIESPSANVHRTFTAALQESLNMQDSLYSKMQDKGWYPTDQAEQQKITTLRQKYSTQT